MGLLRDWNIYQPRGSGRHLCSRAGGPLRAPGWAAGPSQGTPALNAHRCPKGSSPPTGRMNGGRQAGVREGPAGKRYQPEVSLGSSSLCPPTQVGGPKAIEEQVFKWGNIPERGKTHLSQRPRIAVSEVSTSVLPSVKWKQGPFLKSFLSPAVSSLGQVGVQNLGSCTQFTGWEPCNRGLSSRRHCIWSSSSGGAGAVSLSWHM